MAELVQIRVGGRSAAPVAAPAGPRVYVETYGCQMNVADTALVRSLLGAAGYGAAGDERDADVVLLNTCAIREKAEGKVFQRLGALAALKRARPGMVLGVAGCMAEHLRAAVVERAPQVDVIVGPDAYRALPALLGEARARAAAGESGDPFVDVRLDRRETYDGVDPARIGAVGGYVTVQRGCDRFCAFCVVPYTRGRERAVPPREVLRQVRALVAAGAVEVTLLGQTVNSYRHEEADFAELLRAVARVEGLRRVRFTSPHPVDFGPRLVAAIAEEPKVCKHAHLPLQSGDDGVLARMRRGHDLPQFRGVARRLRAAVPAIALTTDLIVGFCDETEEEFRRTLDAVRELRFHSAFTFAYSPRERTFAERNLPDTVPPEVKQRRLAELIEVQRAISREEHAALVGTRQEVLVEGPSRRDPARLAGRTGGFHTVVLPPGDLAAGTLVDVTIRGATSATLFA